MKRALPALACATALFASLAACGGGAEKSGLPTFTGGSSPTASATSGLAPTATKPPVTEGATEPVALAAHSTYNYGGFRAVVNLPRDIPRRARPSIQLFSQFLQADARTTAHSKLDPSVAKLASANVVKDTKATTVGQEAMRGTGSVTYTVNRVQTPVPGFALISGCLDQSKIVMIREDGSHFVDPNSKRNPTLKMTATIAPGNAGPRVTTFTFVAGSC